MRALLISTCLLSLTVCTPVTDEPVLLIDEMAIKAQIVNVLKAQDAAWNAGDIDAFMVHYMKSDDLRFASSGTVRRGWQATLDGYKARYPDKNSMGELSFTDLEIKVLSDTYVQVFGHWQLKREKDEPGGLFTLLMRKENGRWLIVSDHTSTKEK